MINMNNFVKSKQIKCICKIINSEMDSCNAIDKHWLKKYDNTFGVVVFFFVSAPILNFRYCIYSKKTVEMPMQAWHILLGSCSMESKKRHFR